MDFGQKKKGQIILCILFMVCTANAGLNYTGEQQLCVEDYKGDATCLETDEVLGIEDSKEYHLILKFKSETHDLPTFFDWVKSIMLGGFVGILLLFIIYKLIR